MPGTLLYVLHPPSFYDTSIISRLILWVKKLKNRNIKQLTQGPAAVATLSVRPTSGWLWKP